ncbi:expressed unknown protein [Seminavis robusta]|uniref:Uncharacterized protein n=1 Tax=Seminavis robusta TaxID=568900 RepID=A0A9N8HEC8_9STRA|nr:expressed unknown protein [Seminavis robusta]|eukprot:Sro509_g157010.1 n/a (143) ;mRNA; f:17688-18116
MTRSTGVAATSADAVPLVEAIPIDNGGRLSSYGTTQDDTTSLLLVTLHLTEQRGIRDDGDDDESSSSSWASTWYGMVEERSMLDPRSTVILVMAAVAIGYSVLVFGAVCWGAKSSTGDDAQQPVSAMLRVMQQVHLRSGILH